MAADQARISVLIVDDHRAFGEALAVALGKEADLEVLEVTADGATAAEVAGSRRPDVALIDLQMPDVDGLETSRRIRASSTETAVIILTGSDDELALGRAIQAGAHGFLRKTAAVQDLADAVRRAHKREPLNPHDEIEFALRRLGRLGRATTTSRSGSIGSRLASSRSFSCSRTGERPTRSRPSSA